jgi:hypothetical protein
VSTPPRVAELALAAGEYVRKSLGVELDGSAESLAFLDHYVSKIGKVSDAVMSLAAAAIGAYFGEVAIARFGGTWRADDEDPAAWTITLEAAPIRLHPVALAAEAVRRADLADWDASIHVPSAYEAAVAAALEAAGPVEESYYYSLTGRLETLEHCAEVLTELRRRDSEVEVEDERGGGDKLTN